MQDVPMLAEVMQVEAMPAVVIMEAEDFMAVVMQALDIMVILAAVGFITTEAFTTVYIIHALVLV